MADKENIFDSKVVTEEFSFKNSLLFYTILKTLVQCKLSEIKLIRLQEIVNSNQLQKINDV